MVMNLLPLWMSYKKLSVSFTNVKQKIISHPENLYEHDVLALDVFVYPF